MAYKLLDPIVWDGSSVLKAFLFLKLAVKQLIKLRIVKSIKKEREQNVWFCVCNDYWCNTFTTFTLIPAIEEKIIFRETLKMLPNISATGCAAILTKSLIKIM